MTASRRRRSRVAPGGRIRHAALVRRVGAVVVVLGVALAAAAVLMAAVPFSTVRAGDGAGARLDCGIPWLRWAGDSDDRCAELARSRVDGAATVGLLGLVVMSAGFVARRTRPPARRRPRRPPAARVPSGDTAEPWGSTRSAPTAGPPPTT